MTIPDIILELFRQLTARQRAAVAARATRDDATYHRELSAAQTIADAILLLSRKP